MASGERNGCSFLSSTARVIMAWQFLRGWPQSSNLLLAKLPNLASQGGQRDSLPPSVGEQHLLLTQLLEKPSPFSWWNFLQEDGAQQRTPKDGPVIIGMMHFFSLQWERMSS